MAKLAQRGILSQLTLLAGTGLVLALAACAGDVASPAARSLQEPAGPAYGRGRDNGGPRLYSNRDRYRNRSRGHGHGRANNVDVDGIALLGADRLTRLTLSTGTVDPLAAGEGKITKVQVKAYSPQGVKLYVTNFNNLAPNGIQNLTLRGLADGALLYIRVHVRGARVHATNCRCNNDDRRGHGRDDDDRDGHGRDNDNHGNSHGNNGRDHDDDDRWERRGNGDEDDCNDDPRTDVVTLTETVKAGPALDVDVDLPPSVVVGAPTPIVSTVTEINGDVGATANCQLWVNGQLVDRAIGIWVDAGDAVTCAFTYTFNQTGNQQVEVRVSTDGGLVYQPSVVSDGGTLNVVAPPPATRYTASAELKLSNTTTITDYTWWKPDGSHKEYSQTSSATQRTQTMRVDGTITRPLQFPLTRATLTMSSAGSTWENESWTGLTAGVTPQGDVCANRQVPEQGALFWVCNAGTGAVMGYTRFAGTVVYHSEGFVNLFDGPTATTSGYTWNDNWEEYGGGGAIFPLGATVSFAIILTDAQGTLGFSPVVPLASFSGGSTITPRTCITESLYWLDGGTQTTCNSGTTNESGVRGSTSG